MRGALCDDTKYSCVPKVKLGRILKLNLNSVINQLKPYYTENEDSFGFKLWPRFARFFFAFVPTRFGFFFLFSFPLRKRKLMCPSSKMQNEDIFISNLVPRALFPGFGGVSLSQRFVHPHSQIPSVLGIPRYPPGMPKSLVFWWWWWWWWWRWGGGGGWENCQIFSKRLHCFSGVLRNVTKLRILHHYPKDICPELALKKSRLQTTATSINSISDTGKH